MTFERCECILTIISFEKMSPDQRLALAHDATSSRVIDAVFESSTMTRKSKRGVIMAYIGQYHLLVDDRIGSRVGDRCWANSDPFLKVSGHSCGSISSLIYHISGKDCP